MFIIDAIMQFERATRLKQALKIIVNKTHVFSIFFLSSLFANANANPTQYIFNGNAHADELGRAVLRVAECHAYNSEFGLNATYDSAASFFSLQVEETQPSHPPYSSPNSAGLLLTSLNLNIGCLSPVRFSHIANFEVTYDYENSREITANIYLGDVWFLKGISAEVRIMLGAYLDSGENQGGSEFDSQTNGATIGGRRINNTDVRLYLANPVSMSGPGGPYQSPAREIFSIFSHSATQIGSTTHASLMKFGPAYKDVQLDFNNPPMRGDAKLLIDSNKRKVFLEVESNIGKQLISVIDLGVDRFSRQSDYDYYGTGYNEPLNIDTKQEQWRLELENFEFYFESQEPMGIADFNVAGWLTDGEQRFHVHLNVTRGQNESTGTPGTWVIHTGYESFSTEPDGSREPIEIGIH